MKSFVKNKLSTFLKKEEGSTSVLIVVMMIVLTAFGMAALTTAYAGYKLASKNVEFSKDYYDLESKTSEIEFELVTLSLKAKELAISRSKEGLESYEEAYIDVVYEMLYEYAMTIEGMVIEGDGLISDNCVADVSYVVTEEAEYPKSIGMKLKIYIPSETTTNSINDLIRIINKYEWQEGVGDVNDDPLFDDLFDDEELDQEIGNPFGIPDND